MDRTRKSALTRSTYVQKSDEKREGAIGRLGVGYYCASDSKVEGCRATGIQLKV